MQEVKGKLTQKEHTFIWKHDCLYRISQKILPKDSRTRFTRPHDTSSIYQSQQNFYMLPVNN